MELNMMGASKQWAERPVDERFASLKEMHIACTDYRRQAATARVNYRNLAVSANMSGSEVLLCGKEGEARLSNWAFGQLCQRAEAPAAYLRKLPAPVAASCLNHGLAARCGRDGDAEAHLLFHRNGGLLARAVTSEMYTRVWNNQVTEQLMRLGGGWRVPPARPARDGDPRTRPATREDVMADRGSGFGGVSVKVGDLIAPAGLYASDHDMFAFMVDPNLEVGKGLFRGFFVWNSEVGAASFGLTTFLWRHVCGNHIVWGAEGVREIRVRHVGRADVRAFHEIGHGLKQYAEASVKDDAVRIGRAQRFQLGHAPEKAPVIEFVRSKVRNLGLGDGEGAWKMAEEHTDTDGAPNTAWGFANGLTRLSQESGLADERTRLDRLAGKVMELAF